LTAAGLRVLVLGGMGQLGRALTEAACAAGAVAVALGRSQCDVARLASVTSAIRACGPDAVVNAAAHTALDRANTDAEPVFSTNRDGAGAVAEGCAAAGVPLLHVSTDCVFNGRKSAPYVETDAPAPVSIYGLSKLEGERLVLTRHPGAAVVRTSWLFGREGGNFVKSIVRLAAERDELAVVADQVGCPTAAQDLAAALLGLAARMRSPNPPRGIFHYAGSGVVSRYAFAGEIVSWTACVLGRAPRLRPVSTWERPLAARRPLNAALACPRMEALGLPPLPWRDRARALAEAEAVRLSFRGPRRETREANALTPDSCPPADARAGQ
jgi:dTDP-4-dehydrorhamnose reductase